ncbi:methyltransferase domain-containing protein [Burkholderia cepacia]|uniref:class I SAM-dependent methyltransferase n=1 Tax=Burkholderia cepacia TaxID=292 RepID=UPI00249E8200|nr:class I SAM-dependent methyltransferase [Burkholderia cepacia]WGY72249.1 methyltransferase domain-containing protein [Burkholderia cepacia]
MHKPIDTKPLDRSRIRHAKETYADLCRAYVQRNPNGIYSAYIKSAIGNDATLDRHARTLELYASYISDDAKVLDWGCRHAPDSCMLRVLYPDLDIHGCDIAGDDFQEFHGFANLDFRVLEHEYVLPYQDGFFDVVLGSGVLEHVAFEQHSIEQIWRVLKPDGIFIVTFLPNHTSLTENMSRAMKNYNGHNRLYRLEYAKNIFLRSGFVVEACGYHQVFPTFAKGVNGSKLLDAAANLCARMNRTFESIPYVNRISSNLYFVLRRVTHM